MSSSTSPPRGDQVDALPRVASLFVFPWRCPALRAFPAETRLTGYRGLQVLARMARRAYFIIRTGIEAPGLESGGFCFVLATIFQNEVN